jgi:ubiquitin-protein ligase
VGELTIMNAMAIVRFNRLKKDYQSMQKLVGTLITWKPLGKYDAANSVYPEKYEVTFNIKAPTISGDLNQHKLEIDCSAGSYPNTLPIVKFTTPVVRHPHIYTNGSSLVCLDSVPLSELLGNLCIRLAGFLQYNSTLINPNSLASRDSYEWYLANKSRLPLDHSPLPVLDSDTKAGFTVRDKRPGR